MCSATHSSWLYHVLSWAWGACTRKHLSNLASASVLPILTRTDPRSWAFPTHSAVTTLPDRHTSLAGQGHAGWSRPLFYRKHDIEVQDIRPSPLPVSPNPGRAELSVHSVPEATRTAYSPGLRPQLGPSNRLRMGALLPPLMWNGMEEQPGLGLT